MEYFHLSQRQFVHLNFSQEIYIDREGANAVRMRGVIARTGTYVFKEISTKVVISVTGISITV